MRPLGAVRVIRYPQYKPDGTVCEAYGRTDFPRPRVSRRTLFPMAKSRWEIANQGCNDAQVVVTSPLAG
jgi:hypothetical protein